MGRIKKYLLTLIVFQNNVHKIITKTDINITINCCSFQQ